MVHNEAALRCYKLVECNLSFIIEDHHRVQSIAKAVLAELGASLSASDTEQSIALRASELLAEAGVTETWYYNCPALVLAGERTCLSQSGRTYSPADAPIGEMNLVTIDLSPLLNGHWGDCARSFYVEQGKHSSTPMNPEFIRGQSVLRQLHSSLQAEATTEDRFGDVCDRALLQMASLGFVNLDFNQNVGHTIERELGLRSYLEKGNPRKLGTTKLFTFEPHIQHVGSTWGFKHEEIYYFADGRLRLL